MFGKNKSLILSKNLQRLCVLNFARSISNHHKSYNDLPGPNSYPIIGNLLDTKQCGGEFDILSFRDFLNQIHSKYGEIVKWNNPEFNPLKWHKKNRSVFLSNPDHLKEVLNSEGSKPSRPQLEPLNKLHAKIGIESSLVNSQGDRWRKLRSASNPIVARPHAIHTYLPNHNEVANEFVKLIEEKTLVNSRDAVFESFEENLRLLTLEYVSEITFNKRLKCMDERIREPNVTKFVHAIDEFSVYAGRLAFSAPIWKIYPTKDWLAFENAGVFIYKECRKYIKEAQDELSNVENPKQSILSQYLIRKDHFNLTENDVVSVMSEFLIGGVDTTAVSLYYLLYEIGSNKIIQNKLHDEISSILNKNEEITEEHLTKFKYLKNVVKEAMRLHVVAPTNSRILQQEIILQNHLIPEGTHMLFSNAVITRSDAYFKDPLRFDPDRWDSEEKLNFHASLPFGTGIRMCLGNRIAQQEINLTIIKILQNFEVNYLGSVPGFKIALIASPDIPLKISFTKRIL